jgi:hypothetical protein
VAEGENTEPVYFETLKRRFAAPTLELVSHGAGAGDPRVLANEALRIRNDRRRLARRKELGIGQLEDFDELWIVFDSDVLPSQKLNDGIAYAKSKGIKIAYSEPCFEFWLLLHGAFTTAPMTKCDDVKPYLNRAFGWTGYDKNRAETAKLIPPLLTRALIQTAMGRSGDVRNHHLSANTQFPANPSTSVDALIQGINDAVSQANKFLRDA